MTQRYTRLIIPIAILIAVAIYVVWPNSSIAIGNFKRSFETRLGLDLVGGVQAMLEADVPANTAIDADAMNTAVKIVENRVNGLGVSEALVQPAGGRRIVVELPGEKDPEKALATIKQTGLLEFVDFSDVPQSDIATLEATQQTIQTDYLQSGQTAPVATPAVTSTATVSGTAPVVPPRTYHTVMTGAELKQVNVTRSQSSGEFEVAFQLSDTGAKTFATYTSAHIGKVLAIVLDKKVVSAPNIQNAITDGQGVITGRFTQESANNLAVQLRYGSLPIPLKVVTSQTVGPTLGQDSLDKSLIAGIIGLSVVMLFMALYYRLPGILADVALLTYALLSFMLFKVIPVTLTLAGIAGFVLSVGVAVDANILIFERMKEELRAGRNLRTAIDLGWQRAWPSIRDSNLSTLITCAILFWFGNTFGASIVKGFSLTLALGVMVSMFTAIIVTRTFLHLVLDNVSIGEHHSWFAA